MDLSECYGLGAATPTIDAAVSMRQISGMKTTRLKASEKYLFDAQEPIFEVSVEEIKMRYICNIISYAQGMDQLCRASPEYQYNLNIECIAKIWRWVHHSCEIFGGYSFGIQKSPTRKFIIISSDCWKDKCHHWCTRKVVQYSVSKEYLLWHCPMPSIIFMHSSKHLPLNLIQAQDLFGSITTKGRIN